MIGKNQSPDIGKGTQWKPGESGNQKGNIHLSTKIQNMLNDPRFTQRLKHNDFTTDDGATPLDVITGAALVSASKGDKSAREWLGKYGYGTKVDITTGGEPIGQYSELTTDELRKLAKGK